MRRPLVGFAVFFTLGIITAEKLGGGFVFYYLLALFFLILSVITLKSKILLRNLFIPLAIFFTGTSFLENSYFLPNNHILKITPPHYHGICLVKGRVASPVAKKSGLSVFILNAEELSFGRYLLRCCGKIWVSGNFSLPVDYNRRLILRGRIFKIAGKDKPFAKRSSLLISKGVFYKMHAFHAELLEKAEKKKSFSLFAFSLKLKSKIERILFTYMPQLPAGIMAAMILGEKSHISPFLYQSMIRTGTVHILVVSGFNVGIVTTMCALLFKVLRFPSLVRLVLTVGCVVCYCLMAGASSPVVRATVMAIFFLLGQWLQRDTDVLVLCAASSLAILFFSPQQIFDLGFQLSFASVLGIVLFYPRLNRWFKQKKFCFSLFGFLWEAALVSLSAWLATIILIAFNFKIFSPITVLANIFIAPLATLITLSGFSLVATACFFPFAAGAIATSCEFFIFLLLKLNLFFSSLPGAYFYFNHS